MTSLLDGIGYNGWILPALLGLPLAGALLMVMQGSMMKDESNGGAEVAMRSSRSLALWIFGLEALLSLGLWWSVDASSPDWTGRIDLAWIPEWGVRFTIGIDGIAQMLILLTTIDASATKIDDFAPLLLLPELESVDVSSTDVASIAGLELLEKINDLKLRDTDVADITPLLDNTRIRLGDRIDITGAPLDSGDCPVLAELAVRKAVVITDLACD